MAITFPSKGQFNSASFIASKITLLAIDGAIMPSFCQMQALRTLTTLSLPLVKQRVQRVLHHLGVLAALLVGLGRLARSIGSQSQGHVRIRMATLLHRIQIPMGTNVLKRTINGGTRGRENSKPDKFPELD